MTLPLITYALLRARPRREKHRRGLRGQHPGLDPRRVRRRAPGHAAAGPEGPDRRRRGARCRARLVLLWRATRRAAAARWPQRRWSPPSLRRWCSPLVQLDTYKMASGVFRRGDLYSDARREPCSSTGRQDHHREPDGFRRRTAACAPTASPTAPSTWTPTARASPTKSPWCSPRRCRSRIKPEAKNAAIIGMGTGLTTHTLLANSTHRIGRHHRDRTGDGRGLARLSRRATANAFADPRSHIVFDDAKTFFSTHNRKYDIIISEPSNPWVSGVSSLFTERVLPPGAALPQARRRAGAVVPAVRNRRRAWSPRCCARSARTFPITPSTPPPTATC